MFAGDVKVDEVLANNDVGDTITIVSHLKEEEKSEHCFSLNVGTCHVYSFYLRAKVKAIHQFHVLKSGLVQSACCSDCLCVC